MSLLLKSSTLKAASKASLGKNALRKMTSATAIEPETLKTTRRAIVAEMANAVMLTALSMAMVIANPASQDVMTEGTRMAPVVAVTSMVLETATAIAVVTAIVAVVEVGATVLAVAAAAAAAAAAAPPSATTIKKVSVS
jgi:hypothetical protein